ncbi:MAG: hypothetical protein AAGA09_09130 [Pseudomonadota bacterium]
MSLAGAAVLQLAPMEPSWVPPEREAFQAQSVEGETPLKAPFLTLSRLFALEDLPMPVIPVVEPPKPDPRAKLHPYVVVGIVLSQKDNTAIIKNNETGAVRFVKTGEIIETFRITAIESRSVVLADGSVTSVLSMPVSEAKSLVEVASAVQ